jgi:ABC-type multidrug transport system fused ATPase/permease subunit
MFAWLLRGLVVNEFDSGKYNELVNITLSNNQIKTVTEGEAIIMRFGFTDSDDEAYTFEWAGWGILFTLSWAILAIYGSTYFLSTIRFAIGGSLVTEKGDDEVEEIDEGDMVTIPFKRVDLTFKDIHYTVKASTSDEKLELLKGIYGVVEAGRMTALMGSSGAGRSGLFRVLWVLLLYGAN